MRFLVDTNVLCEATRPEPAPQVIAWLRTNEHSLALDPVVLGEIRFGIACLPSGTKRRRLEEWFESGVRKFTVLSWDAAVGVRWGDLLAALRQRGVAMPVKDSLIAASALHHGLVVVTRNTADFRHAGVEVLNPFQT